MDTLVKNPAVNDRRCDERHEEIGCASEETRISDAPEYEKEAANARIDLRRARSIGKSDKSFWSFFLLLACSTARCPPCASLFRSTWLWTTR